MKSRTEGVQRKKYHIYEGKELLPKDKFYLWAEGNVDFEKLFEDYRASGFERRLAPSVDRIDPTRGYSIDNMEFVTMSENSRRGAISRHHGKHATNYLMDL